jgi:DNA polymerase I-like protein with 3'-5' exonuclease and polymerase domains
MITSTHKVSLTHSHVPSLSILFAYLQQAKAAAYGIMYGQGHKALAKKLGCGDNTASTVQQTFINAYPGVKVCMQTPRL